jgi:hypothetical protein
MVNLAVFGNEKSSLLGYGKQVFGHISAQYHVNTIAQLLNNMTSNHIGTLLFQSALTPKGAYNLR